MTWFKVDDGLHSHPKAVRAGRSAIGLWVMAGSWSAFHGTDGFVPDYVIATQFGPGAVEDAETLVKVRLWTRAERDGDTGCQFHQWEGDGGVKRQPTRQEVDRQREMWRDRQNRSRGGKRPQTVNGHSPDAAVTSPVTRDTRVTHADVTGDSRVSHGPVTESRSHGPVTESRPVPTRPSSKPLVVEVRTDLSRVDQPEDVPNPAPTDERRPGYEPFASCPEHGMRITACDYCRTAYGDAGHHVRKVSSA